LTFAWRKNGSRKRPKIVETKRKKAAHHPEGRRKRIERGKEIRPEGAKTDVGHPGRNKKLCGSKDSPQWGGIELKIRNPLQRSGLGERSAAPVTRGKKKGAGGGEKRGNSGP